MNNEYFAKNAQKSCLFKESKRLQSVQNKNLVESKRKINNPHKIFLVWFICFVIVLHLMETEIRENIPTINDEGAKNTCPFYYSKCLKYT